MTRLRIGIVGAGIGGLALAHALLRHGHRPTLFERRSGNAIEGGGLLLWTNAMLVLESIAPSVAREVRRTSTVVEKLQFYDWSGARLLEVPLQPYVERFGAQTHFMVRSQLTEILLSTLPPGLVRWGANCTGYDVERDEVRLRFGESVDRPRSAGARVPPAIRRDTRESRERSQAFDVVVGADGIESTFREQLLGAEPKRFGHQVVWVGNSPLRRFERYVERGCGHAILGGGKRFCACIVGRGSFDSRLYWYATEKQSRLGEKNGRLEDENGMLDREELARLYDGHSFPAGDIIRTSADPKPFPMFDRPPRAGWSAGRVTLLGDAAHATTADLGQGACQSIEDAVVLADALAASSSVPQALQRYASQRFLRTARISTSSHLTAFLSMITTPGADLVRATGIRGMRPILDHELSFMLGGGPVGSHRGSARNLRFGRA